MKKIRMRNVMALENEGSENEENTSGILDGSGTTGSGDVDYEIDLSGIDVYPDNNGGDSGESGGSSGGGSSTGGDNNPGGSETSDGNPGTNGEGGGGSGGGNNNDNSSQNQYPQGTKSIKGTMTNYGLSEGLGLSASLTYSGYYKITANHMFVSIEVIPFRQDCTYSGMITLYQDGKQLGEYYFVTPNASIVTDPTHIPLGDCSFNLPNKGNIKVKLTIGLTLSNETGSVGTQRSSYIFKYNK